MSTQRMIDFCQQAGVTPELTERVVHTIEESRSPILAVSGKIASGKDTIGHALAEHLYGENGYRHTYFASPLKGEVDAVLNRIRNHRTMNEDRLAERVSDHAHISYDQATHVVSLLVQDLKSSTPPSSAWVKTPGVRAVLQFWGTEIRRGQDPDYWTKAMIRELAPTLADGHPVLITDCRFPNELDMTHLFYGASVRLDVPEEVQKTRLLERDGHDVVPNHPSETALDDCKDFTVRIENNGKYSVTDIVKCLAPAVRDPRFKAA